MAALYVCVWGGGGGDGCHQLLGKLVSCLQTVCWVPADCIMRGTAGSETKMHLQGFTSFDDEPVRSRRCRCLALFQANSLMEVAT